MSISVALLDDDIFSLRVAETSLQRVGYLVLSAGSSEEAIRFCRDPKHAVRLVVADFLLPTCKGTDVALQIVATCPEMKFLFISGTPMEHWPLAEVSKLQRLPAGSSAFLAKPFLPAELTSQVHRLLSGATVAGALR